MKDAKPTAILRRDYEPPSFLIDKVELSFQLEEHATRVRSTLHMRRNPEGPDAEDLTLDGQDIELLSLSIDGVGRALESLTVEEESLTVPGVPSAFILEMETQCDPAANKSLEGLYVSSGNFCTQCEAEGFRKITYYLDRPDVMAPFRTRIEADQATYPVLLSNGNPLESGELEGGRHYAVWDDPFKKPCYLFALVAGHLVRREDSFRTRSGRDVALHVYVEERDLPQTVHCMASLKKAMAWDEEVYGREYDLDIFQIVAVGDFNMGAMENKGLNIFNTKYVLADSDTATDADFLGVEGVVGHEYFHNWSGNRVTCRDWFQLSLKEGFTVFRDQAFSAAMGSPAVKRIEDVQRLRAAQFPEDAGPTAHPIRPDSYVEINNFYTLTVYEKGAEVVRMLHTLLGATIFRKATDLYFERHDGQAVTCDEFVQAMEDASGRDLSQFRRWYALAGTPRVKARYVYDDKAASFEIQLSQRTPDTPGQKDKPPMLIPVAVGLLDERGVDIPLQLRGETEPGPTTRVLEFTDADQTFTFTQLSKRPTPSLFRGFSAPVKLDEELTDEMLFFRMAHDGDALNRWDASQTLGMRILLDAVPLVEGDEDPPVPDAFLHAFGTALADDAADPALLALALGLPTQGILSEELERVNPDHVFLAREWLRTVIAATHGEALLERYRQLTSHGPYLLEPKAIGQRMLRNLCLHYLCAVADTDEEGRPLGGLALEQFEKATNMTDSLAALGQLTHTWDPGRAEALHAFFERHRSDALALDKWFGMQAISRRDDVFETLDTLLAHPEFDLTNPNKVRALVGSFAAYNPVRFHSDDGRGYAFLADRILELDRFNPQIAARLVTPLARWRRFDEGRSALMRDEVERVLAQDGLSKDVYEIASKALAA